MEDKRVAIFGGSFDPPTIAHQMVAQIAYSETEVEEVWFLPCYQHQFNKNIVASEINRWQMCHQMCEKMGDVYLACDFEIQTKSNGKLYDVLKAMEKQYREWCGFNFLFYPIVGMDCANDIPEKWHRGKDLIQEYPFIVIGRGGVDSTQQDWFRSPPHKMIDLSWTCSSTMVRKAIQEKDLTKARKRLHPVLWTSLTRIYGAL